MILNIGCSIVIHNTGLPIATLVSFLWVLAGLVIAWFLIVIYKMIMQSRLERRVEAKLRSEGIGGTSLSQLMEEEYVGMLHEQTWAQRLFNLKSIHGALMFTSWINIAGRIFASNQKGYACTTAPAYKPFLGATNVSFVPYSDPNYNSLPWAKLGVAGWGAVMLFVPLLVAFVFGLCYVLITQKIRARNAQKESKESSTIDLNDAKDI